MTIYWDALRGEETLLACWRALTQLSPAARMINTSAATAAVFPSWAPLNNAILQIAPDDRAAKDAVSQLAACYVAAGVATWALWARSGITNLNAPHTGPEIGGLQRDTTTLVMYATLSSGWQLQDGVVRTSIATATRASDEPVRHADLERPEGVPGLTGWVMLHESVAVAGAWSFLNGRDCGIYTVGTQPEWRRHGFARALMEHVLADAWREPAIDANGRAFVPITRLSGRRPLRGMALRRSRRRIGAHHKSMMTPSVGCALQIRTFPSAGGSSGSGS